MEKRQRQVEKELHRNIKRGPLLINFSDKFSLKAQFCQVIQPSKKEGHCKNFYSMLHNMIKCNLVF